MHVSQPTRGSLTGLSSIFTEDTATDSGTRHDFYSASPEIALSVILTACREEYVIVIPFRISGRRLFQAVDTGGEVNVLPYSAFQILKSRSCNSTWMCFGISVKPPGRVRDS